MSQTVVVALMCDEPECPTIKTASSGDDDLVAVLTAAHLAGWQRFRRVQKGASPWQDFCPEHRRFRVIEGAAE